MSGRDLGTPVRLANPARRGIPTQYSGINFRSRLEAIWARFFDLCGWGWEYEPFDLDGYIPDFLLRGAVPCLVDVRPLTQFEEYHQRASFAGTPCNGHEVLIIGAGLIEATAFGAMALGIVSEDGVFDRAVLMTCRECGAHGYFHESGSWRSRVCGHYDGAHYLGAFDGVQDLWAQAKNGAQWKAVAPLQRLAP